MNDGKPRIPNLSSLCPLSDDFASSFVASLPFSDHDESAHCAFARPVASGPLPTTPSHAIDVVGVQASQ